MTLSPRRLERGRWFARVPAPVAVAVERLALLDHRRSTEAGWYGEASRVADLGPVELSDCAEVLDTAAQLWRRDWAPTLFTASAGQRRRSRTLVQPWPRLGPSTPERFHR